MKKKSLLIIGAGACGLMAAKELSRNFDITILEAASRIGGRINSTEIQDDIIESGAEFVHGNLPLTMKLLKQAHIKTIPVKGKFYRKENGLLTSKKNTFEGWDQLLKKMKAEEHDVSLNSFLKKNYDGEKNRQFRDWVISYTEGFDIADAEKVSIKSLYKEWNAEEDQNFRIPKGYSSLINYLKEEANCTLHINKKITKILWDKNKVSAVTDHGETFHAEKILITLPVGLLKQAAVNNTLTIEPSVNEYLHAAEIIGYGTVIKTIIKFRQAIWPNDAGFLFSKEKFFPTWWTQSPAEAFILTGWCGGPQASMLSREPDEIILSKALNALSSILSIPVEKIKAAIIYSEVYNWKNNNFAAGAYSYDTIYSAVAKELLNTPILDTVFFAGEALYSGRFPGTVEAALQSGKAVSKLIFKS